MSSPPDPPHPTSELIRRALDGETAAREELGQALLVIPRMVRSLCRRRGYRLSEAQQEDISQDTMLLVWKKLQQFEGYGTFEWWLARFCQFQISNHVRSLSRDRNRMADLEAQAEDRTNEPETTQDRPELERLSQALQVIAEDFETVIRLHRIEEKPMEEVAQVLGISLPAARARYYRGLKALRQVLDPSDSNQPTQGKWRVQ